jgi:23S rRNA pseudouridine955/2504/2580 synthase
MIKNSNEDEWIVGADYNNKRIDYFLKKKLTFLSYPIICKIIRKGQLKVNGKKINNSYFLKNGDSIKLYFDISIKTQKKKINVDQKVIEDVKSWIILKNKNFIAFNKPSGFPVQGGSKIKISLDDVLEYLKFSNTHKPKLVHRIDKDTSGLLIVARNLEYAKFLTKLFRTRSLTKNYLLLVHGFPDIKGGLIDTPIQVNNKEQKSLTYFSILKTRKNSSLVLAHPVTGRKNQLRRHFSSIGHPIIGDEKFGFGLKKQIKSQNFFLHSLSIKFNEQSNNYDLFAVPPFYFEKKLEEMNYSISRIKNYLNQLKED